MGLLLGLLPLLIWFTYSIHFSICDNRPLAQPDPDDEVLAIDNREQTLVVGTSERIYFYSVNPNNNAQLLGAVNLPRSVDKSTGFLEFVSINRNSVFFCDVSSCSLCTRNTTSSTCSTLDLTLQEVPLQQLVSARAVRNPYRLVVRLTDKNHRAGILTYPLQDYGTLKPTQSAADAPYIERQRVVAAFTRGDFSYFVGVAYQPDEAKVLREGITDNKTFAKISRVCSKDKTKDLLSRIDVHISCGSDDGELADLEAADFSNDVLTVIMRRQGSKHVRSICSYDMTELERRFENVWDLCQKTTQHDICEYSNPMPEHCNIFTRAADAYSQQTCLRFGLTQEEYKNCDLDQYGSTRYQYGWLEDFRAVPGKLQATLDKEGIDHVNQIVPHPLSAYFISAITDRQGNIYRISNPSDGNEASVLWSTSSSPPSLYALLLDSSGWAIYMINSTRVNAVRITCSDLYHSCNDIMIGGYRDSLGCAWCTDKDREGVVAVTEKFVCTRSVTKQCPPIIDHATMDDDKRAWELFGTNLAVMRNAQILVCNQTCNIDHTETSPNKISCRLPKGVELDDTCPIELLGELDAYKDFRVQANRITVDRGTDAETAESGKKNTRDIKIIIAVCAVVIILLLVGIIIYFARRYRSAFKPGHHHSESQSSRFGVSRMPNPASPNTYVDSDGISLRTINTSLYAGPKNYELLFKTLDTDLLIDYRQLWIERIIGGGNFGQVFSAKYLKPVGDAQQIQEDEDDEIKFDERLGRVREYHVACKIPNSTSEGSSSGITEFINEGTRMAEFNHPRVLPLIGISVTDDQKPVIISEFMERGDLIHYLKDANERPTLRILLRFATQIAEGMKYIHAKKFIHRDLAARNCMLDGNLDVKIADFGLCRHCDENDEYVPINDRQLPIRWMPLEALTMGKFSYPGDVWAYGVVMWELTTRGNTPYGEMRNFLIQQKLEHGYRLEKPLYCPDLIYNEVMLPCWLKDPDERPTFSEVIDLIEEQIRQIEQSQLSCHYEKVTGLSNGRTPGTSAHSGFP